VVGMIGSVNATIVLLMTLTGTTPAAQEAPAAAPPEQVWEGLLSASSGPGWGPPENQAASELLRQLSHPEFAKREQATAGLRKMGRGVFHLLGAEYRASRDLEKRLRIHQIALEFYLLARVPWFDDGFLGIQMRPDDRGVRIDRLLPGSAAEAGGLQQDDLIVELDGERVPIVTEMEGRPVEPQGDLAFLQRSISARKSGEQIELLVVRRGQVLSLRIPLGRRKPEYLRSPYGQSSERLRELHQAETEFEQFWGEHFEAGAETQPAFADPQP